MKSRHVDTEVKPFFYYFQKFAERRDYSSAYDDFLTIALTQFVSPDCEIGKEMHAQAIAPYNSNERALVSEMFKEMLLAYQKNLTDDNSWFDFFGDFYQQLSSKAKSSRMGQFFTPEHICDLITEVLPPDASKGKRINDPTCGSGRMLLSHHVKNLGNYYVGEDLDLMCCKMSALNFLLHGVEGEIIWHCSLSEPDSFRLRFTTNKHLNCGFPIPHVFIERDGKLPFSRSVPSDKTSNTKTEVQQQLSLF